MHKKIGVEKGEKVFSPLPQPLATLNCSIILDCNLGHQWKRLILTHT